MLDAVFPANVVRILGGAGLLFALGCAALASAQESGHTTAGAAASDGEWTTSEQVERGAQLYEQRSMLTSSHTFFQQMECPSAAPSCHQIRQS